MDNLVVIHNVMNWVHLTENWLYTQVKYLPEQVQSHIVCKDTANLDVFGVSHIHCWSHQKIGSQARMVLRGLLALRMQFRRQSALLLEVARDHGARLVHSHFGYTGWRYARAVRRVGLRHVVTFYGVDVNRLPYEDPRWIGRYQDLFEQVDRVLCEGPHMGKLVADLGCPQDKIGVHHLGIRTETIPFRPRARRAGQPLGVLIAASFREKKGIPLALEVLGQIKDDVPLEITIVGDAGSGEEGQREKRRILATIDRHGLVPKVRLLGYQPHGVMMEEAYRHHVFLCPSFTTSNGDCEGGAPIGMIEMAASGMPVVSTKHCDIPAVFGPDGGALLADEHDVQGLAERLVWLAENPGAWDQITTVVRRRIEQEYDAEKQGLALAGIYRDVVRG